MNRYSFLFLAVSLLAVHSAGAQDFSSVKGTVFSESTHEALQYVTVAVLDGDGKVVGGATTDSLGMYSFKVSGNVSECRLLVSFVGYVEQSHSLSDIVEISSGGDYVLKDISLKEDAEMLAGSVVSDKRKLLEHRFDRIVLNVSELSVAQTGNALDVLKSSPGVTIDSDGNVKLNGMAVSVWIDDRPSQMSGKDLEAFLQGSSGTSIEKVELIGNPSSKYDAEGGGGIINIRTKKGFMKGFSGTLSGSYGMEFLPAITYNTYLSANLMYKNDRHNVFFQYTPGYYSSASEIMETKIYGAANDSRQETRSGLLNQNMRHNIRLGYDWTISKKDLLGVIVGANFSDEGGRSLFDAKIRDWRLAGTPEEYLYSVRDSYTKADSDGKRASVNLNYTHKFDESKEQELVMNFDYNLDKADIYNIQRNILSEESSADALEKLESDGFDDRTDRAIDIYSLKADYAQTFWKETGRIEAGAKAAYSRTMNSFGKFGYDFPSGALGPRTERNDFTYREQVYAAYLNVSKKISEKWNAQVGLRGEYTVQSGDWLDDSGVARPTYKDYFDVFPTAFVSYAPSQKAILTANYSYRISRPKYWQLNPFRRYVNATTYNEGNPGLQPFYSHNVSLSSVLFSHLTLTVGYSMEKGYSYTQVPKFDQETGMLGLVYDNAGDERSVYVSAALSELPLTKWWNLTLNLGYYYMDFRAYDNFAGEVFGKDFNSKGGAFSGYASTTFFLPKSFKLTLDGWYMTGMTNGYYKTGQFGMANFRVTKTFSDGKASLTLSVNDILDSSRYSTSIWNNGVRTYNADSRSGSVGFSIGFTWRFGQGKGSVRRNVGKLDEADRL